MLPPPLPLGHPLTPVNITHLRVPRYVGVASASPPKFFEILAARSLHAVPPGAAGDTMRMIPLQADAADVNTFCSQAWRQLVVTSSSLITTYSCSSR